MCKHYKPANPLPDHTLGKWIALSDGTVWESEAFPKFIRLRQELYGTREEAEAAIPGLIQAREEAHRLALAKLTERVKKPQKT